MTDDVKTLAADQIRKWKMVEELYADPQFKSLFLPKAASVVRSSGVGTSHGKHTANTRPILVKNQEQARPRGYMTAAVHSAIVKLPHEFTSGDIEKELKATPEFKAGARNINIAINDALGILRKRGVIEPTRRKRGFQRIWKKMSQSSSAEGRTA